MDVINHVYLNDRRFFTISPSVDVLRVMGASATSLGKSSLTRIIANQPLASALVAGFLIQIFTIVLTPWDKMPPIQIGVILFVFLTLLSVSIHIYRYSSLLDRLKVAHVRRIFAKDYLSGGRIGRQYQYLVLKGLRSARQLLGEPGNSRSNWTTYSFDRCIAIALIYPLLSALIAWCVDSQSIGSLGKALGLPIDAPLWKRLIFILTLALPALLALLKPPKHDNRRTAQTTDSKSSRDPRHLTNEELEERAETLVQIFAVFFIICIEILIFTAVLGFSFRAISLILIIQFMTITVALSRSIAFGVGSALFCVAVTYSLVVSGFTVGPNASPYAPPFLVGLVILLISCVAYNSMSLNSRLLRLLIVIIGVSGISIFLILFPYLVFTDPELTNSDLSLVFLLPILTYINGFFDWISIGITRYLVRAGIMRNSIWAIGFGILDVFLGLFVLIGLCVAIILSSAFLLTLGAPNPSSNSFEIDTILADLRNQPSSQSTQSYWAYWIVFSSLIPSMVNLSVASFSIIRGNRIFKQTTETEKIFQNGDIDKNGVFAIVRLSLVVSVSLFMSMLFFLFAAWFVFEYILPSYGSVLISVIDIFTP
ncbi:hypothetical protein [Parerythrobacter lacustris]|uniref:Uncharacterized protein n=1 Tax=Parerythrobacter lacustris TaxID=2969984 RepID=A0ABT1XPD6_9SPHN|nr:hypothetical protein [Parerythrobacter lacustris]MCR2833529.1 hypothetical protein [Parerythrobacter lacustris]